MAHINPLLTPEDRQALLDLRQRQYDKMRVSTALRPWMRMFAVDYALKSSAWSKDEMLECARKYANAPITRANLNKVLKRPDFVELVNSFVDDRVAAARETLTGLLPKTLKYVEESIDAARAAVDYKAMPTVVEPVLGRTVPKKEEKSETPPQVIVNLGGSFAKMYADADMVEAEVEELPLPKPDDEP